MYFVRHTFPLPCTLDDKNTMYLAFVDGSTFDEHHTMVFNILWEMVVSSNTTMKISAANLLKVIVSPFIIVELEFLDIVSIHFSRQRHSYIICRWHILMLRWLQPMFCQPLSLLALTKT